jgi:hypothetical protein
MLRPEHPRLDGNAAAGILSEIFGRDTTLAEGACRHCGRIGPLAETIAEVDEAGVILLCRGCGHTLLTYVHAAGRTSLALPGLAAVQWADGD